MTCNTNLQYNSTLQGCLPLYSSCGGVLDFRFPVILYLLYSHTLQSTPPRFKFMNYRRFARLMTYRTLCFSVTITLSNTPSQHNTRSDAMRECGISSFASSICYLAGILCQTCCAFQDVGKIDLTVHHALYNMLMCFGHTACAGLISAPPSWCHTSTILQILHGAFVCASFSAVGDNLQPNAKLRCPSKSYSIVV